MNPKPTISIIVALTRNNAIGLRGGLLYHLPDDLRRFKALTTGHTIIMGRKTFESFPKGALPNRRNIVLSHTEGLTFPGAEVFPTLTDALTACQAEDEVFIIGGASIYRQCLPLADKLYLTHIDDTPSTTPNGTSLPTLRIRLTTATPSPSRSRITNATRHKPFPTAHKSSEATQLSTSLHFVIMPPPPKTPEKPRL